MRRILLCSRAQLEAFGRSSRRAAATVVSNRFAFEKRDILWGKSDKSSKGSWDAPIVDVLDRLNVEEEYCTLSSCSGRAYLWRWQPEELEGMQEETEIEPAAFQAYWPSKKRSAHAYSQTWRFHVCHRFSDLDLPSLSRLEDAWRLHSDIEADASESEALPPAVTLGAADAAEGATDTEVVVAPNVIWLKYEPLVCHVACRSWLGATRLIELSRPAFPRSSLLSWKKRFVVQVIGEDHLDMPVAEVLGDGALSWFGGPRLRLFLQETILQQKFAKNLSRTELWRHSLLDGLR